MADISRYLNNNVELFSVDNQKLNPDSYRYCYNLLFSYCWHLWVPEQQRGAVLCRRPEAESGPGPADATQQGVYRGPSGKVRNFWFFWLVHVLILTLIFLCLCNSAYPELPWSGSADPDLDPGLTPSFRHVGNLDKKRWILFTALPVFEKRQKNLCWALSMQHLPTNHEVN